MGIGAYRHRVALEHPAVVLDPATWDCSLQSAATQVIDGLSAFYVRGRFHPGITLETQINFEGRTFQVQSVTDVEERHVELQLMCVEVVGRGTTPGGAPVSVPPTITTPPVGATIASGQSVTLTVVATGTLPLTYQWTKAGLAIAGATQDFYATGPLSTTTSYAVTVANAYGTVTSTPVTVTVGVAATYQQRVLADGAVAYWPLDDPSGTVARDLAGPRPATVSAGVTLNQPGIGSSRAIVNDGTGRLLPASFPSLGTAFTLEAWVKPTTALTPGQPHQGLLVRQVFTDGDFDWQWNLIGTAFSIRFHYFHTSHQYYDTPWVTTLGTWTHLVLTGGSGQVTAYLNGLAQTPAAISLSGAGAGPPSIAGFAESGTETWGWRGAMQDVAVYARPLTPAEIVAHYTLRIS